MAILDGIVPETYTMNETQYKEEQDKVLKNQNNLFCKIGEKVFPKPNVQWCC